MNEAGLIRTIAAPVERTHRQVHPYLQYGILIGERKHYPLPGRLFRHGTQFDVMFRWLGMTPADKEMNAFFDILTKEIHASRVMQEILFESRKQYRPHYRIFHK